MPRSSSLQLKCSIVSKDLFFHSDLNTAASDEIGRHIARDELVFCARIPYLRTRMSL